MILVEEPYSYNVDITHQQGEADHLRHSVSPCSWFTSLQWMEACELEGGACFPVWDDGQPRYGWTSLSGRKMTMSSRMALRTSCWGMEKSHLFFLLAIYELRLAQHFFRSSNLRIILCQLAITVFTSIPVLQSKSISQWSSVHPYEYWLLSLCPPLSDLS